MIIGHEHVLEFLRKAHKKGKVPHALFFLGPESTGKTAIAEQFAQTFLCDKNEFLGCGTCGGCSPDNPFRTETVLFMDNFEEKEGKRSIGIDAALYLQKKLALSSLSGKPRVVIIPDAGRLTNEAINTLLKTLEEPPKDVYFILTAPSKEFVPFTVLSRTVPLRFSLVPTKTLEEYLRENHPGISKDTVSTLARFSQGRPGRLIEGLSNPDYVKGLQQKYATALNLLTNPLYASLQKTEELVKEGETLMDYLDYFFILLRSLFLAQKSPSLPYALKISDIYMKKFSEKTPSKAFAKIMKELFTIRALCKETNINQRIAFESFLMKL